MADRTQRPSLTSFRHDSGASIDLPRRPWFRRIALINLQRPLRRIEGLIDDMVKDTPDAGMQPREATHGTESENSSQRHDINARSRYSAFIDGASLPVNE